MTRKHKVISHFIFWMTIFSVYRPLLSMNDPYSEEGAKSQFEGTYHTYAEESVQPVIEKGIEKINHDLQYPEERPKLALWIENNKESYHYFIQNYFPLIPIHDRQAAGLIIDHLLRAFNPQSLKNKENIADDQQRIDYFTPLHQIIIKWRAKINLPIKIFGIQYCYPNNKPENCKNEFMFYEDETLQNLRKESSFFANISSITNKLILLCSREVFSSIINYLIKKDKRKAIIENFIQTHSTKINDLIYFSAILKHFECIETEDLKILYNTIIYSNLFTYNTLNFIFNQSHVGQSPEGIVKPEISVTSERISNRDDALKWALEKIQGDLLKALFQKIINQKNLECDILKAIENFPTFPVLWQHFNNFFTDRNYFAKNLYIILLDYEPFISKLVSLANSRASLSNSLKAITSQFKSELSRKNIAEEIQRNENSYYLFVEKYFPTIHIDQEKDMLAIVIQLFQFTDPTFKENKINIANEQQRNNYFLPLQAIIEKWKKQINHKITQSKDPQLIALNVKNYYPDYPPKRGSNCINWYIFLNDDEVTQNLIKESRLFEKKCSSREDLITVCSNKVFNFIIKYFTIKDRRHRIIKNFIKKYAYDLNELLYFSGIMKKCEFTHSKEWKELYTTIVKSQQFTYNYINAIFKLISPKEDGKYDQNNRVKWALEKIQGDLLRALFNILIKEKQLKTDIEKVMKKYPDFNTLFNSLNLTARATNRFSLHRILSNNQQFLSDLNSLKPETSILSSVKNFITKNLKSIGITLGLVSVAGIAYKAFLAKREFKVEN